MNAPRREVHVIEQVPPHEGLIAARVAGSEPDELVEVERGRSAEIGAPCEVQPHELAIQREGRAAGWKTEDKLRRRRERSRDPLSQRACECVGGFKDTDTNQ